MATGSFRPGAAILMCVSPSALALMVRTGRVYPPLSESPKNSSLVTKPQSPWPTNEASDVKAASENHLGANRSKGSNGWGAFFCRQTKPTPAVSATPAYKTAVALSFTLDRSAHASVARISAPIAADKTAPRTSNGSPFATGFWGMARSVSARAMISRGTLMANSHSQLKTESRAPPNVGPLP